MPVEQNKGGGDHKQVLLFDFQPGSCDLSSLTVQCHLRSGHNGRVSDKSFKDEYLKGIRHGCPLRRQDELAFEKVSGAFLGLL